MGHNEELANRVRLEFGARRDVVEFRMMGGLAFMLRGHMCCGVLDDTLMVRVGAEGHQTALAEPHARPMDFTGRPLKGFVFVDPAGIRTEAALARWVRRGIEFTTSLPPKPARGGGGKPHR